MKGNSLSKVLTAAAIAGLVAGTVSVNKASATEKPKDHAEKAKCDTHCHAKGKKDGAKCKTECSGEAKAH